jgi:hypothetical protein
MKEINFFIFLPRSKIVQTPSMLSGYVKSLLKTPPNLLYPLNKHPTRIKKPLQNKCLAAAYIPFSTGNIYFTASFGLITSSFGLASLGAGGAGLTALLGGLAIDGAGCIIF